MGSSPNFIVLFPKLALGRVEGKLRGRRKPEEAERRVGAHLEGVLAAPSGVEDEQATSSQACWGWPSLCDPVTSSHSPHQAGTTVSISQRETRTLREVAQPAQVTQGVLQLADSHTNALTVGSQQCLCVHSGPSRQGLGQLHCCGGMTGRMGREAGGDRGVESRNLLRGQLLEEFSGPGLPDGGRGVCVCVCVCASLMVAEGCVCVRVPP